MIEEVKEVFSIRWKFTVLDYVQVCRSVAEGCRELEASSSSYYEWKKASEAEGIAILSRKKTIA